MVELTGNLRLGRQRQEIGSSRPGLATKDPVTKQRQKKHLFFPFSLTCRDSWSILIIEEDDDLECVQIILIFQENRFLQMHRSTLVKGNGDTQFYLASVSSFN